MLASIYAAGMRRSYVKSSGGTIEFVALSKREKRLLGLIAQGLPYKQIAALMNLRESSARHSAFRLCCDLRVSGRQGLMTWAMSHPAVFESDSPVDVSVHAAGCGCGSLYCSTLLKLA